LSIDTLSVSTNDADLAQSVRSKIEAEAARPFKLEQDYSLRALLVMHHSQHATLLLTVHHQAADAISVGILARELNEAYQAFLEERTTTWSKLPVSYADWAAWQQTTLQTSAKGRIQKIKARLVDFPDLLTLPLDRPRQKTSSRPARQDA
jgi:hypothetical protein